MTIISARPAVPTLVLLAVVVLSPTLAFAGDVDAGKAVSGYALDSRSPNI